MPDVAYYLQGKSALVRKQGESLNQFKVCQTLKAGHRYRMKVRYQKSDLGVYENLAWKIPLTLLDAEGRVVAQCNEVYNVPDSLSLRDTRSLTKTTDWMETEYVHFSVPPGQDVQEIRGGFARNNRIRWHIHEDSVLQIGGLRLSTGKANQTANLCHIAQSS